MGEAVSTIGSSRPGPQRIGDRFGPGSGSPAALRKPSRGSFRHLTWKKYEVATDPSTFRIRRMRKPIVPCV